MTIWPFSSQIARLQVIRTTPRECETRNTVPASSRSCMIRFSLRRRNSASPVASASSIIRISWPIEAAIANLRRAAMPEEYAVIGRLMNSPRSANSTIQSRRASACSRVMPIAMQPSRMLRSPDRSRISAAFTPSREGRPEV